MLLWGDTLNIRLLILHLRDLLSNLRGYGNHRCHFSRPVLQFLRSPTTLGQPHESPLAVVTRRPHTALARPPLRSATQPVTSRAKPITSCSAQPLTSWYSTTRGHPLMVVTSGGRLWHTRHHLVLNPWRAAGTALLGSEGSHVGRRGLGE